MTPKRSQIKVLHLIGQGEWGGGERFVLELARRLDRTLFELEVACPGGGVLQARLEKVGVLVHPFEVPHLISPSGLWRLARLFADRQPLIVQSHGARMNVYTRLAARLAGVPVSISTIHYSLLSYPVTQWRKRLYLLADRWTAGLADRIVCVAEGLAKDLIQTSRRAADRVVVIRNGINTEQFVLANGLQLRRELGLEGKTLIGFLGRLTPEKDPVMFLRAVGKVRSTYPNIVALIVGDGPLRPILQAEARALGLGEACRFLGFRQDVPEVLAALDLFVLSSISEGLPFALLEAMAAGKPVVATAVNGVTEVVRPEEGEGLLVPPRDPAKMADAILRLLSDPAQTSEMGRRARRRVEETFTVERMVSAWTDLYQGLARRTQPKVLLVTADFPPMPGGQARYLWEIWTRLPAEKVMILAPATKERISCPVPIHRIWLPLGSGLGPRAVKVLLLCFAAMWVSFRTKPALICSGQATGGGIAAWIAHELFRIPFVLIVHGGDLLGRPWSRRLFSQMLNRAHLVVANSSFSKALASSYMDHRAGQKVKVIHPPLPFEFSTEFPDRLVARKALGLPEDEPVLLTVTRLVKRKGVDFVLKVLPDLITNYPGLIYLIVGEGPEKKWLQQFALGQGLSLSQVRFEGFVPQDHLPLYYAASDLFVLASRASSSDVEGFGIVYLEAQAAGLPVVAASGGGAPEAIRNQETGVLVPDGDPEALRQAITELLENKEKRITMGRRGSRWVRESFDPSRQATNFWKLLEEHIDSGVIE